MAVDGTDVYWPNFGSNSTIRKAGLDGSNLTTLASGQSGPRRIAIDATSVYWPDYDGGTVMKVAK
jgi:hypothetical protein